MTEIHRGQRGVAYTVFEGDKPEPMEVEILGVLKDSIGPGQDMILARLRGPKPEYTGVVAGMSGSPVYIDGRLVGAISYRIGQFSKEPIAGITPIQQMLEVRDNQQHDTLDVASIKDTAPRVGGNVQATSAAGEIQPIDTALVFGGFSQQTVTMFGDKFRALGMNPVAGLGGAADPTAHQPDRLVPGSAVSAILVRGDLSISGTCTVTYVDPTQLLACGHPITKFGDVSMPMTKAEVLATLASPLNSFKIINTTETVGSFTQDRASAILGRFGIPAQMIPVSVVISKPTPHSRARIRQVSAQLQGPGSITAPETPVLPEQKPGSMHFEVLNNRELTPAAMLASVYQSLSGTNDSADDISYRMHGELKLKGMAPIRLEGIMAPSESASGAMAAAMYVNEKFEKLYNNALQQPDVTGLSLHMEALPERRVAVLESARLVQPEAHPGDTVEVEATLRPYQAQSRIVRMKVNLPNDLQSGPVRLLVSDGATLDKLLTPGSSSLPASSHVVTLSDTVAELNHMHPNDCVYASVLSHSPQAELAGGALPSLPISMANVLEPLKATQKMQLNGETVLQASSVETGYATSGSQVLTLQVR